MSKPKSSKFSKHYSDDNFWKKVKKIASIVGRKVLEPALILYYCLKDNDTSIKDIAIIIGALGYLISPIDIIPDPIPLVGYTDDLVVLLRAIRSVSNSIKEEHKQKAKITLDNIFGSSTLDDSAVTSA